MEQEIKLQIYGAYKKMANIVLRLSTGSTSSTTSNTGVNSLGGKMGIDAAALITTSNTTLNNLFDDITKSQNAAGTYDYRCVYIHNDTTDVAQTFSGGEIFVNGSPLAEFSFYIAPAKNNDAVTIPSDTVEPSGIGAWSLASSAAPLSLMSGTNILEAGEYIYIWVRRRANNVSGVGTVTDTLPLAIRGSE
jgi:hypothetical protein